MNIDISYIIVSHTLAIIALVLFLFGFYKIFKNLKFHNKYIEAISISLEMYISDNIKFKEAAMIPETIEQKCLNYLNGLLFTDNELRLACRNGIKFAGLYYKRVYIQKTFDSENEIAHLTNIFKDLRNNVNVKNLAFYKNNSSFENEKFLNHLTKVNEQQITYIVKKIDEFKIHDYNGKSFDKYIEMSTGVINHILKLADELHFKYEYQNNLK